MKKTIICLIIIFIVVIAIFINWYNTNLEKIKLAKKYNAEFEKYINKEAITGVDSTTIINKAIDNNEQYKIEKNENKTYKNDGKYSTEITIKLKEDGEYYPMEAFQEVGMENFTESFGTALFKVEKIEYHKNGRISRIDFIIT